MKRRIYLAILLILILTVNPIVFAQKATKLPSKIGDGFVLKFDAPYDRIIVDTDEKDMPNRLASEILITSQTKLLNYKGKPTEPSAISPGMKIEIKLDESASVPTALKIKVNTNPDDWEMEVDGYLDKTDGERGFVDGQAVALALNVRLLGTKEWKDRTFASFKDIPLGSLVDLKGTRSAGGVILVKQGTVKPNEQTQIEKNLIQVVQTGLVVPSGGQTGAGVKIGDKTYKLVENLEVQSFVNIVGNRVAPRYMRNLPADDPNNILFRFYVIEDDTANAFAFPDGSVFVNTGLLKRLENEAQLAIIIGHEIAHVTNEHSRRTIETQQNQALWMGVIGAVVGGQLGVLVAQIGYGLLANKFSRELEDQADRVGLYYAWEAGYDVREAPQMWRRMMGDYRETSTGIFLYSDHPSMLSRYRNTNRMMAFNYAGSDFSEAEIGRERYMETIGVYFGWVAPKQKPTITKVVPKTNSTPKVEPQTNNNRQRNTPTTAKSKISLDLAQQFVADKDLQSFINDNFGGDVQKFAASLTVVLVDLNRDRVNEYLIIAPSLCGASNCPTYVYQKMRGNKYKLLLEEYNVKAKLTITSGYRDLQASSQAGADDVRIAIYKYNGVEYKEASCVRILTDRSKARPVVTRQRCQ